jgi:hypothetical protein
VAASPITIALIALGGTFLGAFGAILGSLLTPWVNWGVEKRRLRQDARGRLIQQWRGGNRELRDRETALARIAEDIKKGQPGPVALPETDPMQYEWSRRLRLEMRTWAVNRVDDLRKLPIEDRIGKIPDLLEAQILGIERKWGLPESPV